jgi:hypothetical protein
MLSSHEEARNMAKGKDPIEQTVQHKLKGIVVQAGRRGRRGEQDRAMRGRVRVVPIPYVVTSKTRKEIPYITICEICGQSSVDCLLALRGVTCD